MHYTAGSVEYLDEHVVGSRMLSLAMSHMTMLFAQAKVSRLSSVMFLSFFSSRKRLRSMRLGLGACTYGSHCRLRDLLGTIRPRTSWLSCTLDSTTQLTGVLFCIQHLVMNKSISNTRITGLEVCLVRNPDVSSEDRGSIAPCPHAILRSPFPNPSESHYHSHSRML